MKPLNQTERNKAFYRFLFFFLLTIGLIVTVVFLSIEVPWREGEQARQRMYFMQSERSVTDSFSIAMREAMKELDKFNLKTEPTSAIQMRVQIRVNEMDQLLKAIPNAENSIYALIIRNIRDLNEAKVKLNTQGH